MLNVDKAGNNVLRFPGMALRRFEDDYDICIIDTPPLLGVRLIASLAASDFVVTPVSLGLYELAGVQDLINTIHVVRTQGLNPKLRHVGILPMKTNTRSSLASKALISFRQNYAAFILAEGLPEREAVRQAVATRRPVWQGTKGATRFDEQAVPAARAARGRPASSASSAYVITSPAGTWRNASHAADMNSDPG